MFHSPIADNLILQCCAVRRAITEQRARSEGVIDADVRRRAHAEEADERYLHHYGQSPTSADIERMGRRLAHLQTEFGACH